MAEILTFWHLAGLEIKLLGRLHLVRTIQARDFLAAGAKDVALESYRLVCFAAKSRTAWKEQTLSDGQSTVVS